MSEGQSKSSVNWGGIVNGLLAAGAIIGGALIVCPETVTGIGQSIGNAFTSTESKVTEDAMKAAAAKVSEAGVTGEAAKELVTNTIKETAKGAAEKAAPSFFEKMVGQGIGSLIVKAAGAVIAYMGISYLLNGNKDADRQKELAERHKEQHESFAIREDIRKMQAVMQTRMAAAGHGQQAPARG